MPTLTVITPTYNRRDYLKQCWESLMQQSCMDFQWLIIDDGSSDNTDDMVHKFQQNTTTFTIDYYYKENGGKHTALNYAHPYIKGKYVVILDSDDKLTEDAVETILNAWKQYESNQQVGEIVFLKGFTKDDPICYGEIENTPIDMLHVRRISKHGRDCCDTYRTSLFVQYPFKVFPNERFIGEGSAFLFIEMSCLGVYINKVIYLCEYQENGLTNAGRKMRILNPKGGMYNSKVYMNKRLPLKIRVKKGILYSCYGKFANVPFVTELKENEYKILTLLTHIPGLVLYGYWKKKYLNGDR